MNISDNGLALIKRSEGFVVHVYNDNGHAAIGYGHDLLPGEAFLDGVTQEEATVLLRADLAGVQTELATLVPPTCTQGQWDALCDFGYNLGVGALRQMLSHGWDQVPIQIVRWNHENGLVNPALTQRRQEELQMFKGA